MSKNLLKIVELELQKAPIVILPDGRLSMKNAARYLGLAYNTLRIWHQQGKGPQSLKVGHLVFYEKKELDKWLKRQKRS